MTIALLSARVFTGVSSAPWAEAVLIEDNLISAVGSNEKIKSLCTPKTRKFMLKGRFITPGFIDAHCHILCLGHALLAVDLRGVTSLKQCLDRISKAAEKVPAGQWIVGRNWDQNLWEEGRMPNRHDLDRIAPDNPVQMTRICTHCIWVNSKALEISGINEETENPPGGQIDRDPGARTPSGIIKEAAELVGQHVPEPGLHANQDAFLRSQEIYLRNGITGIHNCESLKDYQAIAAVEKQGNLRIRVHHLLPPDELAVFDQWHAAEGHRSDMLWQSHAKLFADGTLGASSASMHAPYKGEGENVGIACMTPAQMTSQIEKAYGLGRSVAVHAIGDRALTETLDAIEKARKAFPGERKDRIEHVQIFRPSDLERMKKLGITVSNQPVGLAADWPVALKKWGEKRCENAYAWKTIQQAGLKMMFGSDAPIEPVNPLMGIQAAVLRRDWRGQPENGWYPDQCLSVETALKGYFANAAWMSGKQDSAGTLSPGNWADLSIFQQDLTRIPAEEIKDVPVEMTVVNGKIVFRATQPSEM